MVPELRANTSVTASDFAASTSNASSVTVATPVPLLSPAVCNLLLEVCALPYNIDLPQMILCGHISPLNFHITREHMILLGKIAASLGLTDEPLPNPEAEEQEKRSSLGVRVKKHSTMEMFDIMSDVKDLYVLLVYAHFV